eukprot:GHUV01028771.1.p1 GENE.GHUV01028771.1~~GHUV01028771.1.p1  ORF type:complete len:243 (+),score=65.52 GHUV01028771.1:159-887(+)
MLCSTQARSTSYARQGSTCRVVYAPVLGFTVSSPSRLGPPAAAGREGGSSPEQPAFDERTKRALREAAELLSEAQQLAQQQAREELSASWQLAATHSAPFEPSSDTALQAFLVEQGLRQPQAELVLKALHSDEQYSQCLSTRALQQKFKSLQRVLPEADVAALVAAEPRLLLTSSEQLVANLVALVQGLPGRNVVDMVSRLPRLLLVTDMADRLGRIMKKLIQLHPSHSVEVVAGEPSTLMP